MKAVTYIIISSVCYVFAIIFEVIEIIWLTRLASSGYHEAEIKAMTYLMYSLVTIIGCVCMNVTTAILLGESVHAVSRRFFNHCAVLTFLILGNVFSVAALANGLRVNGDAKLDTCTDTRQLTLSCHYTTFTITAASLVIFFASVGAFVVLRQYKIHTTTTTASCTDPEAQTDSTVESEDAQPESQCAASPPPYQYLEACPTAEDTSSVVPLTIRQLKAKILAERKAADLARGSAPSATESQDASDNEASREGGAGLLQPPGLETGQIRSPRSSKPVIL